jgi:hypothetical protein
MCVNHSRADITVAEEFLNRADVIPVLKQVGCKGMAKRMTTGWLCYTCPNNCIPDGSLQDSLVKVMPALLAGNPIGVVLLNI